MPVIERREWLWVVFWAIVILIITSLPYVYGAAMSTPANQFGGFVIGVEDGNSYLAKMRLGATGAWRFHLFYTSEPHESAYLFLFYLLLGKIAGFSRLSFILIYHLARVICGFILLLTVYYFAAFFTDLRPVRQLTFWLVGVGSGLGWLVVLLDWVDRLGLPLDLYSPETFTFHTLFGLPHLSLAEALLLLAILLILLAWERQQGQYAVLAGLALVGLTTIAAFYILVVAAVIGTTFLLRLWRRRQAKALGSKTQWWLEVKLAALALVLTLPVLIYNAYVFTANPLFKIFAAQNLILSPPPVHYLLAFGPLAVLAVIGGWQAQQGVSDRSIALIGWCMVTPLLVYAPFNLQRRLVMGVQVPLSILAVWGLWYIVGVGKGEAIAVIQSANIMRRWRIASVGLVMFSSLSNIMILTWAFTSLSRPSPPQFYPTTLAEAADWLGNHTTAEQVVLAAHETGNYLPTRMSARVFIGHGPETAYAETKAAMVDQFFDQDQADFRRRLLQEHGVTYLFYGPAEQALGDFLPGQVSYLQEVYNNGPIQIYRVVPEH